MELTHYCHSGAAKGKKPVEKGPLIFIWGYMSSQRTEQIVCHCILCLFLLGRSVVLFFFPRSGHHCSIPPGQWTRRTDSGLSAFSPHRFATLRFPPPPRNMLLFRRSDWRDVLFARARCPTPIWSPGPSRPRTMIGTAGIILQSYERFFFHSPFLSFSYTPFFLLIRIILFTTGPASYFLNCHQTRQCT